MYKIIVSALAYDDGKSGISNYIDNVVRSLCRDNRVDVVILKKDAPLFSSRNPEARLILLPNLTGKPAVSALWHLFVLPFTLDFSKYDFAFLPAGNRRLFCRYPIWTVTTFHDLSQFHLAAKYDKLRMFYVLNVLRRFLLKVDKICAISLSTAADIKRFYNVPDEKIFINYNGFDKSRLEDKSVSEKQLREKYAITGKYLLYVARIEHPGKNHLNLIKAYEMLPASARDEYCLVFAGSDWNGAEAVRAYAAQSPVRDRIKFCGFVEDKYLPAFYRHASLYVFPSFCEGFGIPMLEAMACGVPVVCSDRTSLPEIGGDAVELFNPDKADDISRIIFKVLTDSGLCDRLIQAGFQRVCGFDWDKHSKKIVAEYEKSAKRK